MSERLFRQNIENDFLRPSEGLLVAKHKDLAVGWTLFKANLNPPAILEKYRRKAGIGALCVLPEMRRRGIGAALLQRAEDYFRKNGMQRYGVTCFPFHFVPGAPDVANGLIAFLRRFGFAEFRNSYDVMRDISDFEYTQHSFDIHALPKGRINQAIDFVAREFPGGWHFSTKRFLDAGGDPDDILCAWQGDEITGFCHTFTKDSLFLGGSTLWFPLLGENYGGLGPIGIAKEHRGKGLGLALLNSSIEHNKRRGVRNMVIDWTSLTGFYAKAGFKIWKTYLCGEKEL